MEEQEQKRYKIRSHPKGEFLGTMVQGQFILDKRSKYKLEQENIERSKSFKSIQEASIKYAKALHSLSTK